MSKHNRDRRRRRPELTPGLRADLDKLRRAPAAIDPGRTYMFSLGDGQTLRITGRELLATARLVVAMADAIELGDDDAFRTAWEAEMS